MTDGTHRIKTLKRLGLPSLIIVVVAIATSLILQNPPSTKRRAPSAAPQMTVDVQTITPQVYQVKLDSFGTVQPRTRSVLVAQVSGQIRKISENFRDGGFFEQGDVLLELDDRDAKADVKVAKASLLDAEQNLLEEKARSVQAKADWQRLGKGGEPSDLVLRKPQLEAAKAKVLSAEASLEKAQLALERTKITAPYAGRVLSRNVDLGQVVSNNSQLADIYAIDYVEIRLPLNNSDLPLIDLPEEFRNTSPEQDTIGYQSSVAFYTENKQQHWSGKVVRTEGAIDEASQQLYIVAQIDDPYGNNNGQQTPIKIGQYVKAQVNGKILSDVIVIPNKSIQQGKYVYIVEEGFLRRLDVEVLWKNQRDAIIKSGLAKGDRLVVTSVGQVSSGTPVQISGEKPTLANKKRSDKARRFEDLPQHVQERILEKAKASGLSVEEYMAQRRENEQGPARPAPKPVGDS